MSGFDIRYVFYFTAPQTTETLETIYAELDKHFNIRPVMNTQNYLMLNIILPEQLQSLRNDTDAFKSISRRTNAIQGNQTQPLPLIDREIKPIRTTPQQDQIIDCTEQTIATRAPIKHKSWAAIKKS